MKRIIAVVLALSMILVFAGCSKNEGEMTVEEGKLIMATNASFPPYEYYDGEKIVGIDAEIAELIAEKLGLELEIVDIEFGSIIPGVQTGKYDMGMAGMTVTAEREKMVSFTDSYAKGVQVVIVKEGSDIKSIDDIDPSKHMIGVQQDTTGHIYASSSVEDGGYGEDAVVPYANGGLAVEGLKSGKVDCVIIDSEPAKSYVAANEGLEILEGSWVEENYAICINKDNEELLNAVNDALKELIEDGSVQKVIDKYISAE